MQIGAILGNLTQCGHSQLFMAFPWNCPDVIVTSILVQWPCGAGSMVRLAVCGVDRSVCDAVAHRIRGATLVSCTIDTLNSTAGCEFDAVAFVGAASPSAEAVRRSVREVKHVLLATETILSTADLQEVIDAGSAAGVRVVVRNPDQTLPSRRMIHDELRGSRLGIPGLIRLHRWESKNSSRNLDPVNLPAPLVRDLDLVLWLANQLPNRLYAVESGATDNETSTIQVHLGFPDGSMSLLDYADTLPAGNDHQSLSTICAHGAMYADDHANRQLLLAGGIARAEPTSEGLAALTMLIQQFVDGVPLADDGQSGIARWRDVRRLADAVRRSIDTRLSIYVGDAQHV
ncbi:MAG: hypothetical protein JSS49_24795 [Planctomycetes bacterium]|nr:hypothetical protein [Planctomycetota bacterium]